MEIRNGNPVFKVSEASTLSAILSCYLSVEDILQRNIHDASLLRGLWAITSDVSIGHISCLVTNPSSTQEQLEEVLSRDPFPYSTPLSELAEMLMDEHIEVADITSQLSDVFIWASDNLVTDSDFIQSEIADMQVSDYEEIPEVKEIGSNNESRIEYRVGDLVLAGMQAAEWAQQLQEN
jgi:hypothetical protein